MKRRLLTVILCLICILSIIILLSACQKAPQSQPLSLETLPKEENKTETITTEAPATTEAPGSQVVIFKDSGLEKYVRDSLKKSTGDIFASDMQTLGTIYLSDNVASDLTGLEYATNTSSIMIVHCTIKSLEPLAKLKNLPYLHISYSTVEAVPQVVSWENIRAFALIESKIPNIDFLTPITTLQTFVDTTSGLTSLEPIRNSRDLVTIDFSDSGVTDLSPLKDMAKIESLSFVRNQVTSLDGFETLTNLSTLNLSYNKIADLVPIMNLTKLTEITAWESPDKSQWLIDRVQLESLQMKGIKVLYDGD